MHRPSLLFLFGAIPLLTPGAAAADDPLGRPGRLRELSPGDQLLELRVFELLDLFADGVPRKQVVERLARIAQDDPRPVFEVYAGLAARDEGGRPFDPRARAALLRDGLNAVEGPGLFRYLREALAEASSETRLRAIELLVESDRPDAPKLVWEVLRAAEPLELCSPRVQASVQGCLRALFEREPLASLALAKDPAALPPGLWPIVARAAAEEPEGAELLLALLGLSPDVDRIVLERLGSEAGLPASLGAARHAEVLEQVRARLQHADADVREQALVALGRLVDPDSLPEQIALLGDPDRTVQRAAVWALERATGQRLGGDPVGWTRWFDDQARWMRESGRSAGQQLLGCSDADAVTLIRELSRHPVFRHAISDMLAPVLFRENQSVVAAVCATLRDLRSPRAVGHLIDGLEHAQPECRERIHGALVAITGCDLPAQSSSWSASFGAAAE
jgi:HEAT repeat protein